MPLGLLVAVVMRAEDGRSQTGDLEDVDELVGSVEEDSVGVVVLLREREGWGWKRAF